MADEEKFTHYLPPKAESLGNKVALTRFSLCLGRTINFGFRMERVPGKPESPDTGQLSALLVESRGGAVLAVVTDSDYGFADLVRKGIAALFQFDKRIRLEMAVNVQP